MNVRYGPLAHCSSLGSAGAIDQQQSPSQPSTSALVDSNLPPDVPVDHQNFDVPSRALLEAVRSTLEDRKQFQRLNNVCGTTRQKRKVYNEDERNVKECQPIDSPITPIVDCISLNKQQIPRKNFKV